MPFKQLTLVSAALCALALSAVPTKAGSYYLEIVREGDTPDGLIDSDATLGMTGPLNLYIWTDIDNLHIRSLDLTFFTAFEGVRFREPAAADIITLGILDPFNVFDTVNDNGRLNSEQSLLDRLNVRGDAPGILIPTDPTEAILLYSGFEVDIERLTGGISPTGGGIFFNPSGETLELIELGVYATPSPGTSMVIGLGAMLGLQRRRP